MHNPPYLSHSLQLPQNPNPHLHSIQPFVHHPPRSPSYPFQSSSLNLVTPSHFFNDNILGTTNSRPVSSSGHSLPNELGYQHYLSKAHHSPRTPDQSPLNTWPLPMLSGVAPSPGMVINRPWPKTTGSNPEAFHPSVNTQPYHHSYVLEHTDNNPNFSSESESFPPAALPTQATSILGPDIPRPRYQPRDSVVCFSGSESDSGQELDDERNIAHDARRDQWTSASTASPRARSPVMTLSRRFASFLATEESKLGSNLPPKDIDYAIRPSRRTRSSSRKPKMHQCQTCKKWFPRPSGLATHMNVHSGAKPFTCPVQSCNKKFAVRSNAKRHLRTHGIMPTPDMSFISSPTEDNNIAVVRDPACWIPRSLKERNLKIEDPETCPLLISELPLVRPSTYTWDGDVVYEERDSFAEASIAPYHPVYWKCLPGPTPTTAATCIRSPS